MNFYVTGKKYVGIHMELLPNRLQKCFKKSIHLEFADLSQSVDKDQI